MGALEDHRPKPNLRGARDGHSRRRNLHSRIAHAHADARVDARAHARAHPNARAHAHVSVSVSVSARARDGNSAREVETIGAASSASGAASLANQA